MARRLAFAIPGDIDSRTGGYVYDRRLIAELRGLGWSVDRLAWPGSFPFPSVADERTVAASLAACDDGALVLVDGLACGALPEVAWAERDRLRLVALVHHPLALESGLSGPDAAALARSERLALAAARLVVTTSETTARILADDYDVAQNRILVAKPGTDIPLDAPEPQKSRTATRLLAIGTVTPRKGYDVLVDALTRIADLPWTCAIAGSLERSPETADAIRTRIERAGLGRRIDLRGEVEDTASLYRSADIFVLPSRYEGYGMVFAEALAHGLPIVATAAGAIPEVVPAEAGILTPVGRPDLVAEALRRLIGDQATRFRMSRAARMAALQLPRWRDTAARIASALDQLQF